MSTILFTVVYVTILVGVGAFLARYPSDDEAKRKLYKNAGKSLALAAFISLAGSIASMATGIGKLHTLSCIVPLAIASTYIIYKDVKTSKEKGNAELTVLITMFFAIATVVVIVFSGNNMDVSVIKDEIVISGVYEEKIKKRDIEKMELVNELPEIEYRKNGISLGSVNIGYFKTSDGKTVKLFLQGNEPPFIHIVKSNKKEIFICSKDSAETSSIFQLIMRKE